MIVLHAQLLLCGSDHEYPAAVEMVQSSGNLGWRGYSAHVATADLFAKEPRGFEQVLSTSDHAPGLNAAYGLSFPEDYLALYRDWATTCDQTFAAALSALAVAASKGIYQRLFLGDITARRDLPGRQA